MAGQDFRVPGPGVYWNPPRNLDTVAPPAGGQTLMTMVKASLISPVRM